MLTLLYFDLFKNKRLNEGNVDRIEFNDAKFLWLLLQNNLSMSDVAFKIEGRVKLRILSIETLSNLELNSTS